MSDYLSIYTLHVNVQISDIPKCPAPYIDFTAHHEAVRLHIHTPRVMF